MEIFSDQAASNKKLYQQGFTFAVITILYNIIEGLVSMWFGYSDESLALFGFGIDSIVEVISGIGIAHMIIRIRHHQEAQRDRFEKVALKITGISFFVLTAGLTISALYNIITRHKPETTLWGIIISAISIITMVLLIAGKTKVGKKLNSDAILADAECTRVCVYMSLILLISSGIYELTGFIYIDSIGTLGLAYFSFNEGRECFERIKNKTENTFAQG